MIVEKSEDRKEYIKPQLVVVDLSVGQQSLLCGSCEDDPTAGGDTEWNDD
ncbi:hypothetical protein SAMN05720765_1404 [Fibrobacter sp. UWH6]|nr:hypothetical protein SAMN05720765_1404 [Fibrobacter sp. UWH6]